VLRRVGDEKDFAVAATVKEHEWTDTGIDYGKPYSYAVQALVDAGNQKMAESDLSASYTQVPKDSFPPAVPAGCAPTAPPIRCRWCGSPTPTPISPDTASTAPRATARGRKLADVNTVPSYSDRRGARQDLPLRHQRFRQDRPT
jgi:hypothetical protein